MSLRWTINNRSKIWLSWSQDDLLAIYLEHVSFGIIGDLFSKLNLNLNDKIILKCLKWPILNFIFTARAVKQVTSHPIQVQFRLSERVFQKFRHGYRAKTADVRGFRFFLITDYWDYNFQKWVPNKYVNNLFTLFSRLMSLCQYTSWSFTNIRPKISFRADA